MKLPAFLAGFVDPILKDDGYDRAGATYFRGHPSGDQEIVWFQKLSSSYRSVVSFRPIASIDPQLARDVIVSEARRETAGPQTKIGLWSRKM